jgi:transposase
MPLKTKTLNFEGQVFHVGIDVHKKNWKVKVRSNHSVMKSLSVDPNPDVLSKTLNNLYPHATFNTVYEAGFSGYWAHRQLKELGINNIIVNPADIPTSNKERDRKSDPIDCGKLSRELENGSLKGIYIPSEEKEGLRSLSRLLHQNRKRSTQVKNRIKSYLHFTGVSITTINESSHWSKAFLKFLQGIRFGTEYHQYTFNCYLEELLKCREERLNILRKIRSICAENETIQMLRTIPGIGPIIAFVLYTELMDMVRFSSFDRLASYVGLVPSTEASGEKLIVKGLTARHARYLRYLLVESAWHAVRKDPVMSLAFLNYTKRMSKQRAIIRIAKKLLSRIRYVWKNNAPYEMGIIE